MKSVQVRTRGEGGSETGDFTAYVLYGCPRKLLSLLFEKSLGNFYCTELWKKSNIIPVYKKTQQQQQQQQQRKFKNHRPISLLLSSVKYLKK